MKLMTYLYTLKFAHRFAWLLGTFALSFCIYEGWSYSDESSVDRYQRYP
jgi:hypothetical protein